MHFFGGQRLVGAVLGAALPVAGGGAQPVPPAPGAHNAAVSGKSWQDKARLSRGFAAISCHPRAHKWAF